MAAEKTKPTVYEAMSAVMADVQAVGKGDRNQDQGYSFRGIDSVVNAVGPAFRKHGVVPVPHKMAANYRDVQTSRGKPSRECTVTVTYRFYGPAGDHIDAEVPGESMDFSDKGAPKAMSVAYRIALLQVLCIPTDEPDPDSHTYERGDRSEQDHAEREARHAKALTLRDRALAAVTKDELTAVWKEAGPTVLSIEVPNENGDDEELGALIKRRGADLAAVEPTPEEVPDAS